MSSRVRPFVADDYPAIAAIANTVYPDYPMTADEMRHDDEHRDAKCQFQRWVVERDGGVVAAGHYHQNANSYHPRMFWLDISVLPDHQRQGLGTLLYSEIMNALEAFEPLAVRAEAREDIVSGVQFLSGRGFRDEMREWESRLDVAAFDPTPYDGVAEQMRVQGIEIKTMRELAADPLRDRKLYDLRNELGNDVPNAEAPTPLDFDYYVQNRLNHPGLIPDAYFVAVHDGQYVGMTNYWSSKATTDLDTGLTGVIRSHRRKGIALALKLRAIAYAQAHNHPVIKTWNETGNEGMLAINQRLGFVRQPAWITLVKTFDEH